MKSAKEYMSAALKEFGASDAQTETMTAGYRNKVVAANSMTCPNCGGAMKIVTLEGGRSARYCAVDRVTLPMPVK